jgi:F-type H+-transporting ATPase subunit delta
MREIRIAKPYAQALYDAAAEQGTTERIIEDANHIIELTQESEDFDLFIRNPILSSQFKSEMFQQLLSETVHPLMLNFLLLLASKQRERFLVSILQAFLGIVDLKAGRMVAQVTSAIPLTDVQQASITQQLSDYSDKEVRLELTVEPAIKGGMIAKLGDTVFDGSVATQLHRMRESLARG